MVHDPCYEAFKPATVRQCSTKKTKYLDSSTQAAVHAVRSGNSTCNMIPNSLLFPGKPRFIIPPKRAFTIVWWHIGMLSRYLVLVPQPSRSISTPPLRIAEGTNQPVARAYGVCLVTNETGRTYSRCPRSAATPPHTVFAFSTPSAYHPARLSEL